MYKVLQFGTGNVGRHAMRAIVERPDLDLVGVRAYTPSKLGVMPVISLVARRSAFPASSTSIVP